MHTPGCRRAAVSAVLALFCLLTTESGSTVAATRTEGAAPSLAAAVTYLLTTTGANGDNGGTRLGDAGYYESFAETADFGLTIDGAFALAAADDDASDLAKVVDVFRLREKDGSGRTADDWSGIGTAYASGGSIGKEALLAEVAGYNPRSFAGHDFVAALRTLLCTGAGASCAGAGNYSQASSVFAQSFGVMAQVRAGDLTGAAPAIHYLEGLQQGSGAWPSLIPDSGDPDVDSTAMAAMALALLPGDKVATAAVERATAWIAGRQLADGGFPGTAGDSTNSAALAIQGLSLVGDRYATAISAARAFLAGQQRPDGGFAVAAGSTSGSDVRASAQVVSGDVGRSFGTLADDVLHAPTPSPRPTRPPASSPPVRPTPTATPSVPPARTATPGGDASRHSFSATPHRSRASTPAAPVTSAQETTAVAPAGSHATRNAGQGGTPSLAAPSPPPAATSLHSRSPAVGTPARSAAEGTPQLSADAAPVAGSAPSGRDALAKNWLGLSNRLMVECCGVLLLGLALASLIWRLGRPGWRGRHS